MSKPDPAPTPIRTLLVANRGEIARRIIRTARAMGITTVAVFSDPDADSPHVAEADRSVRLPGATPAETYLRSALILDAATRSEADAIHPGYGFLSESGDFARVVGGAGLTWVGPPAVAIDAMGSKVEAKEIMVEAGVPTLPFLAIDTDELPDDDDVESIGWPLLVKASAGGGGRGMRVVGGPVNLRQAIASARREALAAFGDDAVFLEHYVAAPRHIEVQIVADSSGATVALFERDCSIQRRHQKIIEESPSPFVTPELRRQLSDAAVTAAKAVGYVNAGTVEFVVDGEGRPYFLEMNTRLQVEHPVTEAVTGLDLVRLQLLIAAGAPLPDAVFDAVSSGPRGHAVEARLYAEDPAKQWQPSVGRLHRFEIGLTEDHGGRGETGSPVGDGARLRVDSGFESGSVVSPYYDSMLAKVVVHAPTRLEATSALASALARARIHGLTTNRDLLVRTLRHADFEAGDTDTGFLDRYGLDTLAAPLADSRAVHRHAVAAALAGQAARRSAAVTQATIPSGYRNNPAALEESTFTSADATLTIGYRLDRSGTRLAVVEVNGEAADVDPELTVDPDGVTFGINGVRTSYLVDRCDSTVYVDGPDGSSVLCEEARFPEAHDRIAAGSAVAPMPGGVVRVAVAKGDHVEAGQALVVLEAMKMEHTVHAITSGTVTDVAVAVGDQVETGSTLVVVGPEASTPAVAGSSEEPAGTDGRIGTKEGGRPGRGKANGSGEPGRRGKAT